MWSSITTSNIDYLNDKAAFDKLATKVVYTGPIDEYFGDQLGRLEYRGLKLVMERLEENHQGLAVMSYTAREVPYTRIIEHKHFEFGTQPVTYVTREYPADWQPGEEAYYPVNDDRNQALCQRYQELAAREYDVILVGGWLSISITIWMM